MSSIQPILQSLRLLRASTNDYLSKWGKDWIWIWQLIVWQFCVLFSHRAHRNSIERRFWGDFDWSVLASPRPDIYRTNLHLRNGYGSTEKERSTRWFSTMLACEVIGRRRFNLCKCVRAQRCVYGSIVYVRSIDFEAQIFVVLRQFDFNLQLSEDSVWFNYLIVSSTEDYLRSVQPLFHSADEFSLKQIGSTQSCK